jgi:hypothetical protein
MAALVVSRSFHSEATSMSIFPVTPLVQRVQGLIFDTFDVPDEEARDHAAELVALAESWGSQESASQLDWSYRIKKSLGGTKGLKWRCEEARKRFEEAQKQKHEAYNFLIGGQGSA